MLGRGRDNLAQRLHERGHLPPRRRLVKRATGNPDQSLHVTIRIEALVKPCSDLREFAEGCGRKANDRGHHRGLQRTRTVDAPSTDVRP
eukprot:6168334-Pyramimonas_sp.AAC.1